MKRIHVHSKGIYGSPKITKVLISEGVNMSQKTVANIMKENNIKSKTVKKYKATTNSNHSLPISPNLLNQNFKVDASSKVWVTNMTYVWTSQGWLYLATFMDLFSNRIIGWAMDKTDDKRVCYFSITTGNLETTTSERTYPPFKSWAHNTALRHIKLYWINIILPQA